MYYVMNKWTSEYSNERGTPCLEVVPQQVLKPMQAA